MLHWLLVAFWCIEDGEWVVLHFYQAIGLIQYLIVDS